MTITQGASGAAAEVPFSLYDDTTGAAITGHTWNDVGGGITDDLKIRTLGGTWTNATIANIVEWGLGQYGYQFTGTDTAAEGAVGVRAKTTASSLDVKWDTVVALPTLSAVVEGIMGYVLRTGRTVRGHLRRMDALYFGATTGLLGALVTAKQPGGATTEFDVGQDLGLGTRDEASVATSETP